MHNHKDTFKYGLHYGKEANVIKVVRKTKAQVNQDRSLRNDTPADWYYLELLTPSCSLPIATPICICYIIHPFFNNTM